MTSLQRKIVLIRFKSRAFLQSSIEKSENTPDGGRIEVTVRNGEEGPEFEVRDFGIGITEENQRLIFENYFPVYETMRYSSRNPYDFSAGGKGFDLLRIKIFSERYHFRFRMVSERCKYIPKDEDVCPGKIEHCAYCQTEEDCILSGGTTMIVRFASAKEDILQRIEKPNG